MRRTTRERCGRGSSDRGSTRGSSCIPTIAPARARFLDGCIAALDDFGIGTIAEIFDAEAPYTPRGCIAQAWSVAEVLRCWAKTAPERRPETQPPIESRS